MDKSTKRTPEKENIVFRLRERARIRRQILTRKSVQEGKPDRIADLLEEAADEIEQRESAYLDAIRRIPYDLE